MGKALYKFSKEKENKKKFDIKEAAKIGGLGLLGSVGGVVQGADSGHKTSGFFLGSPGAAGAESKNSGESKLYESMAGIGAMNAGLGTVLKSGRRLRGVSTNALGGAAVGAVGYGLGNYFGKRYEKGSKWRRGEEEE